MIKKAKQLVDNAVRQILKYQKGEDSPLKTRYNHLNENSLGGITKGMIVVIAGASGCVDNKTEFFNGKEWKYISDYEEGELVLQYTEENIAELVKPIKFHKYQEKYMWLMKSKYGVNQCLSDEHNVVYLSSKGNINKKTFKDLKVQHNNTKVGFHGKFITTFKNEGIFNPNFNENEFRFLIACQADATYPNSGRIVFNLKKDRKIQRLKNILNNLDFKWNETKKQNGYTLITIWCDDKFQIKTFPTDWYFLNKTYQNILLEEIFEWDGYKAKNTYFTTIKQNADIVQFIISSNEFRSRIIVDNRKNKPITYGVYMTNRIYTSIKGNKSCITKYTDFDGFKYCFTVPSNMLVLRREGNIFITGNSGKTHVLQEIEEDIFNPELNPDCKETVLLRCNWEMVVFKLLLRKLKRTLNKTMKSILFEEVNDSDADEFKVVCDSERNDNIYYLEEPTDPKTWYEVVKEFLTLNKHKKQVIITIDHLALVRDLIGNKKKSMDDLVEYINSLKKEFNNVSFILISQLNRDIEGRTDVRHLAPKRSDLYNTDTLFQIADLVLVIHNPYKLGHEKYMIIDPKRYEYLEEWIDKPDNKRSNFNTKNAIFFHYLKIREIEDMETLKDIYVEPLVVNNFKKSQEAKGHTTQEVKLPQTTLEKLPDNFINGEKDDLPF